MIKKIFLKTLTIKYLIFFTILNILYANDKDFRPQKNIFNKINDYYLKDSYNYYGTKKKVLLVDISDINKLIIGDKDLEEIFEIDDIPIKIVNEYFFSKNNVYYCGEKIKDVDLNSFEILPYGFSKDKNSLYFEGEKILENIKNFKFLGGNFFLINDKIYVLFFEEKARILEIDFNTLREVKIDIPTMKILGKNYISDKNNIYYVNNIIENVDKNSFKILDENLTPKVRQRIMEKSIQNQPNEASRSFFGWVIFFIKNDWMTFLKGTLSTLYISITGTVVGFFIGLLVALLRYSEAEIDGQSHKYKKTGLKFLNWLSSIYIAVFRGTPMIVQSMVIYYGLSQVFHINLSPMVAALFIVSINKGAYMSEIIRGGIDSIDNGQFEAAKAIGMTNFQLMQSIIFPQMFRNILPMIGNELIVNIKDTSVLNVISVTELFFISNSVVGTYSRYYEVFIITSVIYFFLTFTLSLILKQIEKRIDGPQHFEILDDANGEEK